MNNQNNKPITTQKKLSKKSIRFSLEGMEKYAKVTMAAGIATVAFAIWAKKHEWLDNETTSKIGLTGLGITCVSSIPFIAKEVDGKKIAHKVLAPTQDVLSLGGN